MHVFHITSNCLYDHAGAKILITPLIAGLAIGAAAVLVVGGIVVLPFYGAYRLRRYYQRRNEKRPEKVQRFGDIFRQIQIAEEQRRGASRF